jgi:hypothetical protein
MVANHKIRHVNQFITGDTVVRVLIACILVSIAAIILTAACAGMLAGKAEARANIQDYFKGPNDFYPARHDVEGPTKLVIDTVGWNATAVIGNAGIGNGDVSLFDVTSTQDVEYPESAFMCGDVSTQPLVPGKKNIAETPANASEEYGGENATLNATDSRSLTRRGVSGNISQPVANRTMETERQNATEDVEQARAAGENLTYDAYHPIQYLSPVRDILYEHPLATSGTAYCELLGFETPSGDLVNVGMKCTGYGY